MWRDACVGKRPGNYSVFAPVRAIGVERMVADQVGNDFRCQVIEYLRIAEEPGDIDKQVLGKMAELDGIAPQNVEIAIHASGLDRCHRHAPLDPPLRRAQLVERMKPDAEKALHRSLAAQ